MGQNAESGRIEWAVSGAILQLLQEALILFQDTDYLPSLSPFLILETVLTSCTLSGDRLVMFLNSAVDSPSRGPGYKHSKTLESSQ